MTVQPRRQLNSRGFAIAAIVAAMTFALSAAPLRAAGTLTPYGAPQAPIQIRDHHVNIVINNGFAKTEVIQTFFNPNPQDLEALYAFPVPKSASLSEVTIYAGERELHGEVLPKAEAQSVYEQEKSQGKDAGLATKESYQRFEFRVTPVRANSETRVRFVYYQPVEIDTGVGRYVYPLEDGGTDEAAQNFWLNNDAVEGTFSADIELKSAVAVSNVRIPGFDTSTSSQKIDDGHYKLRIETQGASLSHDLVFYYKLADNLPGRIEVIPYRAAYDKPGTFMMIVTPGIDLGPLDRGADYVFVLDVSGSMEGKIHTLIHGVIKALGEMRDQDRVRIIAFSSTATDVSNGWVTTTKPNVQKLIKQVEALQIQGSTNLYDGLAMALKELDADRATSLVLVTDGVTNTGVLEPAAFDKLMRQCDVRVFGFLMGNSANWPLMRVVCEASGGFYAGVSNDDDILGQLMLAKSKITHECLHDATLKITGVKTFDKADELLGKVYRGQQVVMFGRYDKAGEATVTLEARITGENKRYTTTFQFPEINTENPELERLWALSRIETIEHRMNIGKTPRKEADQAIEHLGVAYQIVNDQTAMVVLADESFEEKGIDRRNKQRTAAEREAQARRDAQPVKNYRVDEEQPAFDQAAPTLNGGSGGNGGGNGGGGGGGGGFGGAIDPITGMFALGLAGLALFDRRQRRAES